MVKSSSKIIINKCKKGETKERKENKKIKNNKGGLKNAEKMGMSKYQDEQSRGY